MTIITIHEESHGFIGTATTMKAAFHFLIEHDWLTPEFDLYDETTDAWFTVGDVLAAKGIEPTKENILAWAMEYADDAAFWDGAFYFMKVIVHDEENWLVEKIGRKYS